MCQTTKLKQFSNDFDVLDAREGDPWIEGVQCQQPMEDSSRRVCGEGKLYRVLEEAGQKQGLISQDVGDFLIKQAGPLF